MATFPNGFTYRRRWTVNHTNVIGSDQTDFPVLFRNLSTEVSTNGTAVATTPLSNPEGGDQFPYWLLGAQVTVGGVACNVTFVDNATHDNLTVDQDLGVQASTILLDSAELRDVAHGGLVNSPTGLDIIFTDENDNLLPFERVWYDPTTGQHEFWVKRSISSTAPDTQIWMYYGGPQIDRSNKTAVWSNGYIAVFHFGTPSSLDLSDSTGNGNDGTNNGAQSSAGFRNYIGGGAAFSAGQYIAIGNVAPPGVETPGAFTLEACILWNFAAIANQTFFDGGPAGVQWFVTTYADKMYFQLGTPPNTSMVLAGNMIGPLNWGKAPFTFGAWGSFFATATGPRAADMLLYNSPYGAGDPTENWGQATTPVTDLASSVPAGGSSANIGLPSASTGLVGVMDELRLSSVARSGGWIGTQVNNTALAPFFFGALPQETYTEASVDFGFGLSALSQTAVASIDFSFRISAATPTAPPFTAPPFNPTGGTGGMKQKGGRGSILGESPRCIPNGFDLCLYDLTNRMLKRILCRQLKYPGAGESWNEPPPGAVPFTKANTAPAPVPASGDTLVAEVDIPLGYDAALKSVVNSFTGPWAQGSGDLIFRIKTGRVWARGLGNVTVQLGSTARAWPVIGAYLVRSQNKIRYYVQNTNSVAIPPGVDRAVCRIEGWFIPRT